MSATGPLNPFDMNALLLALDLGETQDWEFKSAKGGVPRTLWETYSAMANSEGGTIVLGLGLLYRSFTGAHRGVLYI